MKLLGVALIAGGTVLLVMGYNSSKAIESKVTKLVTGNPSDRTMTYYIAGAVCAALGCGMVFRKG